MTPRPRCDAAGRGRALTSLVINGCGASLSARACSCRNTPLCQALSRGCADHRPSSRHTNRTHRPSVRHSNALWRRRRWRSARLSPSNCLLSQLLVELLVLDRRIRHQTHLPWSVPASPPRDRPADRPEQPEHPPMTSRITPTTQSRYTFKIKPRMSRIAPRTIMATSLHGRDGVHRAGLRQTALVHLRIDARIVERTGKDRQRYGTGGRAVS